ncbi:glutamate--tRNA ligase [Desulfosarcina ovata subsp. sediminis]|uniref:Glutamate--tRNA ligase n=1 Tax=Desulfosarcina ovata subsp. sediminis TaxID=885957 RepID=A0A5K7ZWE0_9BACT|nr:glutamate--tRNA ligase [Desulfosarcina ovata]BBO84430.1 glutamate--tRNA ligase [Desulfosarcina ovata subsp. sediminis]
MDPIITRFPPSPTGYLHVGGARTALFNWLYARHNNGKFVLRIEDTDTVRSTQVSVDAIFDAMQWLELDWDDGPYFQTQRFDIYREYLQKLIDSGDAYYCTCTPEEVDAMRQKAKAAGAKPKYDGRCRERGLGPSDNAVIRFKSPLSGTTVVEDVIKGNIVFQNTEQDDFVICRSDGTPTYNFVVVVDDITMGINTIIRGDDHVMNTPKQILLYKALKARLPVFGHVPMVLGKDKTRLSKRHGAMSVTAYRDMGFLPDAFINYLARLGWSYGDQEFFTRRELVEKFSLKNIGRSPGVFDPDKLTALNADHIRAASVRQLAPRVIPFFKQKGYAAQEGEYLDGVIDTLHTRSKTLVEMAEGAHFYYRDDVRPYEEKAAKKFLKPAVAPVLARLAELLEELPDLTEKAQEGAFKQVMDETGLGFGKIAQPVRVALTGTTVSPGIFEMIEVLGKARVLSRLKVAIELMESAA